MLRFQLLEEKNTMKIIRITCILVTKVFVYIHDQVKEVRNRGDETARIVLAHQQEGQEPPGNLKRDFEHLLDLVSYTVESEIFA